MMRTYRTQETPEHLLGTEPGRTHLPSSTFHLPPPPLIESRPQGLDPGSIEKNTGSDDEKITFRPGAIKPQERKTHGQSENR
jgi:hypothetical protein